MNLISVAVISMCLGLVCGQSSPCLTPVGKSGECVSLTQCEPLLTLANKPAKTYQDLTLLRQSTCGSPSFIPNVCCQRQVEPDPVYGINGPCSTPDGQPGKCVSIYSCPHISNMLKPPVSNEVLSFVQKSKCPSTDQYSVCCGPPPVSRPVLESQVRITPSAGGCPAQMTAFPPDPSSQCCGEMASVGNKIVGAGQATLIDEHPWSVLIEYTRRIDLTTGLNCGGSLISGKYVVTAGHCISGKILDKARPKRVRLGEFDTSHDGMDCVEAAGGGEDCTDGAISFDIERTIPHPKYNQAQSKRHDIGLIRLKGTAPYTDFIRPICLPTRDLTLPENMPPSFSLYAVGWGKTEFRETSNVKLQVSLPFVSMEKCQPEFNKNGRTISLWRGQLCAGGVKGKDACKGDSGGPLVYENQTKFELIGVVSFGLLDCGEDGVPGIYTNVYEYLDWIKSVIVA